MVLKNSYNCLCFQNKLAAGNNVASVWKCWLHWKQAYVFIDLTLWDTEDTEKMLFEGGRMSHGQTLFSNIKLKYVFIIKWYKYTVYNRRTFGHNNTTHTQITTSLLVANVERFMWSWKKSVFTICQVFYKWHQLGWGQVSGRCGFSGIRQVK